MKLLINIMNIYSMAYYYGLVGAGFGTSLFIGNMASVFVPGNQKVDPQYEWSSQNLNKMGDCLVISATKALIGGTLWPYFFGRFISQPSSICGHYNIGHIFSPAFEAKK